jgi:Fibronectin type III domain
MTTISQLPPAGIVTAADLIPISQAGSTCSVPVGSLLAGTQPAIIVEPPCLLGRVSLGPGGPDVITVGEGLILNNNTLTAAGFDLSTLPSESAPSAGDQIVVSNTQGLQLLAIDTIRDLFTPGQNITIDSGGTISAAGSGSTLATSITDLSQVESLAQNDLVGVSQGGADHSITYANLLDGLTIDLAQPAGPAADSDSLWVSQSGNVMLRQSFAAVWPWLSQKLLLWKRSTFEFSADTTLDGAVHNNSVIVCSQPLLISGLVSNMGSGFSCDLINVGSGTVSFASDIVCSNGTAGLGPYQYATVYCVTYSSGTIIFAAINGGTVAPAFPGQVSGLAMSAVSPTSVALTWFPPATGGAVTAYSAEYRITGNTAWSVASQAIGSTSYTVAGLTANTSYDFAVVAVNAAGSGPESSVLTVSTPATTAVPGSPTGLTATNVSATSVTCSWTPPSGSGLTYEVRYQVAGQSSWTTAISGITATSYTISGLASGTSYQIDVVAANAQGMGTPSAPVAISTPATPGAVTSISWNVPPSGTFNAGTGAIGVNAHVTPGTAAVQFGFSASNTIPPSNWVAATYVNTDLWGAYVSTPASPGSWYGWVEGTDGSSPTVYPTPFTVT